MLEVLKKLYGEAVTEESLERFKEELGKRFVPKADFNQRGEELKMLREKAAQQEEALADFQKLLQEKEALQQALLEAEAKQAELIEAYEGREAQERLRGALERALKEAGARNVTAVKALLDMGSITLENGELKGFFEQLRELKKENGYLFEAGEHNVQFVRPAARGKSDMSQEDFKKMGYMERLKMKREQPEQYQSMMNRNRR